MDSTRFEVRRAVSGDEPVLRELRLHAIVDSPEAFGSTYDREVKRTTADWQKWLSPGATFILYEGRKPVGIVAGVADQDDRKMAHLMAMWVCPSVRGTGAAAMLVSALVAWARTDGARRLVLDVFHTNLRGRHFYECNGFQPTGQEFARESDGRVEVRMERRL